MINVAFVFLGIVIAMIGVFIPLTPPPETENERAALSAMPQRELLAEALEHQQENK